MHIDSISRSPPCNDTNYSIMTFTTRLGFSITYRYL